MRNKILKKWSRLNQSNVNIGSKSDRNVKEVSLFIHFSKFLTQIVTFRVFLNNWKNADNNHGNY